MFIVSIYACRCRSVFTARLNLRTQPWSEGSGQLQRTYRTATPPTTHILCRVDVVLVAVARVYVVAAAVGSCHSCQVFSGAPVRSVVSTALAVVAVLLWLESHSDHTNFVCFCLCVCVFCELTRKSQFKVRRTICILFFTLSSPKINNFTVRDFNVNRGQRRRCGSTAV